MPSTERACAALLFLAAAQRLAAATLLINAQQADYRSRPEYVRDHLAHIENLPFDGLVIKSASGSDLMSGAIIPYAEMAAEFAPIRGLPFSRMKHNFAWVNVDRPADFFGDWSTAVANFRTFARVLRESGIEGVFFDNEEYRGFLWDYPDTCEQSRPLGDYEAQARLRGRELMQAMMQEYPNLTFLALYGPYTSFPGTPDEVVALQTYAPYEELRGPLTLGFIEGMSSAARFIDGGTVYAYRTPQDFQTSYLYRKYTLGLEQTNCSYIPSYVREYIWPLKVHISFGVYDKTFRGPEMNPSILRPTLVNALAVADDYVWLYSESGSWNAPGEMPQPYINSVVAAKGAASTPPYDPPPWVSVVKPLTESTFLNPVTLTISAAASGIDQNITKVEFFSGATKIGEKLAAPYDLQWTPAAVGTYALTARATAANGLTSTSAVATIYVTDKLQAAINFQPASVSPPLGYILDSGETYASRGNGFTYGWNVSHVANMRNNTGSLDVRLDTICQLRSGALWEMAVPNGTYNVTVAIGDGRFASNHTINVEGVNYWTNKALAVGEYINATKTVTVSDGKLSLNNGAAAFEATRLNYVLIAAANSRPRAPGGVIAISSSPGVVDLRWLDHSSNEDAFDVERSTTSDFTTRVALGAVGPDATAYEDATAVPGQRSYYRVSARNATGSSSWSIANYVDVQWPDSDTDGVPDPLENPPFAVGVDDRQVDSDGDGLANAAEYLAATDPADSASRLAITQMSASLGGAVTATACFPTVPERNYLVEFNGAPGGGVWTLLPNSELLGDGATHCFADTPNRDRYYRIMVFRP